MPENTIVHIGENSPEQVAYKLLQDIASVEDVSLSRRPAEGLARAERKWILDTYAECLMVVRNPWDRAL